MTALAAGLSEAHNRDGDTLRRVEAELTAMAIDAAAFTGQANRHRHQSHVQDLHGQAVDAAAYRADAALFDARAEQLHADAARIRHAMTHVVPTPRAGA